MKTLILLLASLISALILVVNLAPKEELFWEVMSGILFVATVIVTGVLIPKVMVGMPAKPTWKGFLIATSPNLIMLGLIYLLALDFAVENGPKLQAGNGIKTTWLLKLNESVVDKYSTILGFFTVCVVPLVFCLCLSVRPWRHLLSYIAIYFVSIGFVILFFELVPSPYHDWCFDIILGD